MFLVWEFLYVWSSDPKRMYRVSMCSLVAVSVMSFSGHDYKYDCVVQIESHSLNRAHLKLFIGEIQVTLHYKVKSDYITKSSHIYITKFKSHLHYKVKSHLHYKVNFKFLIPLIIA